MLDEFRSTSITWDKATRRIYSPITANASDENGRKLVVQIVNGGQVEDLTGATLHLYWETRDKAHDGLDVFEAVDLKKGEFELSYTTGMLSNQGVLNANLVLIDTVGRVVSERFKITVTEGIDNDAIQSENSFSSLTQALIDISNLEQNYAPRLNDITAQLQQTEQSLNAQLEQAATKADTAALKADAMASGSPKGVYATLALLQAAYPTGTTGAYLVTADGNWYYWSGSAWASGGVYQAITTPLADLVGVDMLTEGYIERFLPQNHWLQDGWSGTAIANVTNRTSVRENQTIDSTFDLINTNENLYEVRAYKYNNETDVLENTFLAPAYDLPAGKYKFDIRNPDNTINFYAMDQTTRNATANAILRVNVGKLKIPYLEDEISELKGLTQKFEKPFVIIDFDWYTYIHETRYQILKGEYGYNATFCLDNQTTAYALNDYLPRAEFNKLIEDGWDVALYGGVGSTPAVTTEEVWTPYIQSIVDQKKAMGIFNPVIYNTPSNRNDTGIMHAVKNNGFKLQRCTTTDNLLKSPDQFQTGALFMTTSRVPQIKIALDTCVANNYGVVLYTHKVLEDSLDINDGQDAVGGHIYETSFRAILDYIKAYVDAGQMEVLTARQYYSKYHPEDAIEHDENRNVKMQNFILSNITIA